MQWEKERERKKGYMYVYGEFLFHVVKLNGQAVHNDQ